MPFVMTLIGHKNHYNVKFLRGYGASIALKNHKICLKGGRDAFTLTRTFPADGSLGADAF